MVEITELVYVLPVGLDIVANCLRVRSACSGSSVVVRKIVVWVAELVRAHWP